ncbi:MAG: Holliday junction branch migration protein RuvA [Oligoflexia bacterium]|nr:Holliday junction branch migration protein RuvA [Oligoflexia bacterium]
MIARLQGIVLEKRRDYLILDVHGVGYGLLVPETVMDRIPNLGQECVLHVYTHVREDQLSLFGFSTRLEKEVFEMLLTVSGVGPKLALTVLSALSAEHTLDAIASGNRVAFKGISGVGKKTLEKILIDLREKAEKKLLLEKGVIAGDKSKQSATGATSTEQSFSWTQDLEQALVALGYKDQDVRFAIRETLKQGTAHTDFDSALRYALKFLSSGIKNKVVRGTA